MEPFQERHGGRIALVADVVVSGQTITTYNLHLESKENDELRVWQLREVLTESATRNSDRPALLAGDLNLDAAEGEAAAALVRGGFRDAVGLPGVRTRPARGIFDQGRSIDWMFVAGTLKSSNGKVHSDVRASDHYPVSFVMSFS